MYVILWLAVCRKKAHYRRVYICVLENYVDNHDDDDNDDSGGGTGYSKSVNGTNVKKVVVYIFFFFQKQCMWDVDCHRWDAMAELVTTGMEAGSQPWWTHLSTSAWRDWKQLDRETSVPLTLTPTHQHVRGPHEVNNIYLYIRDWQRGKFDAVAIVVVHGESQMPASQERAPVYSTINWLKDGSTMSADIRNFLVFIYRHITWCRDWQHD